MTMPPFNHRWEKRLHEELKQLPEIEAPASLVPNVMAAIRARQAALAAVWYRRPATTWPMAMRVALAVSSLTLFGLLVFAGQMLPSVSESPQFATLGQQFGVFSSIFNALFNAISLVMRETVTPWLLVIIGAACASYVALFGIGSALWRTVLHPRAN